MPVEANQTLLVILALFALIILLLVAWRINVSRQLQDQPPHTGPSQEALRDARIDPGERVAEPFAEQIESMVHNLLAGEADLDPTSLDFGTEEDGSLAIWYGGNKYTQVDEIPEPRVRQAVEEAVDSFNRPAGGSGA